MSNGFRNGTQLSAKARARGARADRSAQLSQEVASGNRSSSGQSYADMEREFNERVEDPAELKWRLAKRMAEKGYHDYSNEEFYQIRNDWASSEMARGIQAAKEAGIRYRPNYELKKQLKATPKPANFKTKKQIARVKTEKAKETKQKTRRKLVVLTKAAKKKSKK